MSDLVIVQHCDKLRSQTVIMYMYNMSSDLIDAVLTCKESRTLRTYVLLLSVIITA